MLIVYVARWCKVACHFFFHLFSPLLSLYPITMKSFNYYLINVPVDRYSKSDIIHFLIVDKYGKQTTACENLINEAYLFINKSLEWDSRWGAFLWLSFTFAQYSTVPKKPYIRNFFYVIVKKCCVCSTDRSVIHSEDSGCEWQFSCLRQCAVLDCGSRSE